VDMLSWERQVSAVGICFERNRNFFNPVFDVKITLLVLAVDDASNGLRLVFILLILILLLILLLIYCCSILLTISLSLLHHKLSN
jgi:hypothetical protein